MHSEDADALALLTKCLLVLREATEGPTQKPKQPAGQGVVLSNSDRKPSPNTSNSILVRKKSPQGPAAVLKASFDSANLRNLKNDAMAMVYSNITQITIAKKGSPVGAKPGTITGGAARKNFIQRNATRSGSRNPVEKSG